MSRRDTDRLRVGMLGTRGVPAHYGGFETCVEEVGTRLAGRGHDVVVYCRSSGLDDQPRSEYRGMRLVHLPAHRRRSLETLTHTGASVAHLLAHPVDAALVFNAANAPWLPLLQSARIPVATHMDGLEWKRAKWGPVGKRYYRVAESMAVRWSNALIADAPGIQDYYRREFGVSTTYLAYGAPILQGTGSDRLVDLGLEPGKYHLVVARFEPENHVHLIVEGYVASAAAHPLVVVGSAPYADEYTRRVQSLADGRVHFVGGVWDQELLDQLYANALIYWHGHSVGGTNPSLLRAMGAGAAINAFDVNFNRDILGAAGHYFARGEDVPALVARSEADPWDTIDRGRLAQQAAESYDWDSVTDGYEALCRDLIAGRCRTHRSRGRRTGAYPMEESPWAEEALR